MDFESTTDYKQLWCKEMISEAAKKKKLGGPDSNKFNKGLIFPDQIGSWWGCSYSTLYYKSVTMLV